MKKNDCNAKAKILSDEKIIALYWMREERAISATDDKYGRYLYTIAYNVLHDNMDCEECLNDTYLGTWRQIPPHRPSFLQVFLARIMRNIAVDRYRRNTAGKRIPSEMMTSLDELDDCISAPPDNRRTELENGIRDILNTFLKSLSERERFVFVCRYYYADSIEKIALMLGVSERTVHRDLAKLREELRIQLRKAGYRYE